jgi:hypothetical protein
MARTFTLERKQERQGAASYNAYCTAEAVRTESSTDLCCALRDNATASAWDRARHET